MNSLEKRKEIFMRERKLKGAVMFLLTFLMVVTFGNAVFAASNIKEIVIEIENEGEFSYPDVFLCNTNCYIEKTEWSQNEDILSVGSVLRITLVLRPEYGYRFRKNSKTNVSLFGSGTSETNFTQANCAIIDEEECRIVITYYITGIPDEPKDVRWGSSNQWIAVVDRVPNALGYEFTLYAGNQRLAGPFKEKGTSCDFSQILSKRGVCLRNDIYCEVVAIRGDNRSAPVYSEYYDYWDELYEMCNKVYDRTWNHK